jgi:hypothetical protein
MKGIDFLEILKLGLPGLVFLLSLLSFWLLTVEQKRPVAREGILKTIRKFIYVNVAFVTLTAITPMAESNMINKSREFTIKATTLSSLKQGFASVCSGVNYAERYLLIRNPKNLGNLIQVQAKTVAPCGGEKIISISPEDALQLGLNTPVASDNVTVAAAMSGTMFVM